MVLDFRVSGFQGFKVLGFKVSGLRGLDSAGTTPNTLRRYLLILASNLREPPTQMVDYGDHRTKGGTPFTSDNSSFAKARTVELIIDSLKPQAIPKMCKLIALNP